MKVLLLLSLLVLGFVQFSLVNAQTQSETEKDTLEKQITDCTDELCELPSCIQDIFFKQACLIIKCIDINEEQYRQCTLFSTLCDERVGNEALYVYKTCVENILSPSKSGSLIISVTSLVIISFLIII